MSNIVRFMLTYSLFQHQGVTGSSTQRAQRGSKCQHQREHSCHLASMPGRGGDAGGSAVSHAPYGEAGSDALPHQAGPGTGRPGEGTGHDLQASCEWAAGGAQWSKGQAW